MKKVISYIMLFCAPMLCFSCLKSVEQEITPQAAITSFVIGYYKVKFHDINVERRDTMVYYTASGYMYPMTIDQVNNRIFNVDSLEYGSCVDGVTTSVGAVGTVFYRYTDDPEVEYYWYGTDSIDFTRPLIFSVISSDGTYKRDYSVQLNVRKVFQDSLRWTNKESAGFTALQEPCAVIRNDSIYDFGIDSTGVLNVIAKSISGGDWSLPAAVSGIPVDGWKRNVITLGDMLYAQSGTSVYSSSDGKNWSEIRNDIKNLVKNADGGNTVWAVCTDSNVVKTVDMTDWNVVCKSPAGFPETSAMTVSYPLTTNSSISRTVLVGIGNDSLYASVWGILSTDSVWTEIDSPANADWRLPATDNLSVIRYDDCLFAFGTGLDGFRQSNDNGITWYWCDSYAEDYSTWNRYMQFPSVLKGFDGDFSYVVDRFETIWIMTSDGQVWRGSISRLDKRGK